MNKYVLHFASVSILGLGFTACSLKKDAETMRDATKNIETNSKQLTTENNRLSKNMRQVECENGRNAAIEAMSAAEGDSQRFKAAAKFMVFNEFQKWTGDYGDSVELREDYLEQAVKIFFPTVMSWINRNTPINIEDDPIYFANDAFGKDFRKAGAMAAEMDYTLDEQKQFASAAGVPVHSMYSLIVSGLSMRGAKARGEAIPKYATWVIKWKVDAVYLLQLRHNFLIAKVLGLVSNFSDNYVNKILMSTWATRWLLKTDVDLDAIDDEALEEYTELLNKAEETRADLLRLGFKPQYNSVIMDSWKSLNFKTSQRQQQFTETLKSNLIKAREKSLAEYK